MEVAPSSKAFLFHVIRVLGIMWTLQKMRNDLVFNDKIVTSHLNQFNEKIVTSPPATAHMLLAYLSQWKVMLKPGEKNSMEETIGVLARAFQ
ncbi:unnamed protein product [Urochloa humidicola]